MALLVKFKKQSVPPVSKAVVIACITLTETPQHRLSIGNTGQVTLLAGGYAALFEEIYSYAVVNLVNLLRPPIQWIHCSTIIFLWKTTSQD